MKCQHEGFESNDVGSLTVSPTSRCKIGSFLRHFLSHCNRLTYLAWTGTRCLVGVFSHKHLEASFPRGEEQRSSRHLASYLLSYFLVWIFLSRHLTLNLVFKWPCIIHLCVLRPSFPLVSIFLLSFNGERLSRFHPLWLSVPTMKLLWSQLQRNLLSLPWYNWRKRLR